MAILLSMRILNNGDQTLRMRIFRVFYFDISKFVKNLIKNCDGLCDLTKQSKLEINNIITY